MVFLPKDADLLTMLAIWGRNNRLSQNVHLHPNPAHALQKSILGLAEDGKEMYKDI